jgi:D-arabinose 1-dehydrogenase-like Zn-dependent alcohol dehydrogenase
MIQHTSRSPCHGWARLRCDFGVTGWEPPCPAQLKTGYTSDGGHATSWWLPLAKP